MAEEANLRLIDPVRDAVALAEMWNESDLEWPGTWNEGTPRTAQNIRDWHEREIYLAVYVWDEGGKIGGYCTLIHDQQDDEALYLPLLNVSPEFQGRSIGRKMLVRSVEKTIEEKRPRLDLDTWSGNVKAMAAYKRTGFCWDTGPEPLLRNYIPAIRQMPCTQYFFDRYDWYETLQRSIEQVPDEEQWEGLRVFTYRFEAHGEQPSSDGGGSTDGQDVLTVRVDREARHVAAVETAELSVAASVDDIEPVQGRQTTLRWKLQNRKDTPVAIALTAKESGDLSIDYHAQRLIQPGESVSLEAPVTISAEAAAVARDKPAPRVYTHIRWGDLPVELATGIRPKVEMALSIDPDEITLAPGTPQSVRVNLQSQLPDVVVAQIRFTLSDGLSADSREHAVTVPRRGLR